METQDGNEVKIKGVLRVDSTLVKERVVYVVHEIISVEDGEIDCPFVGEQKDTTSEKEIKCEFCGAIYKMTWNHYSSSEGAEYQYTHQPCKAKVDLFTIKLAAPHGRDVRTVNVIS